MTDFFYAAGFFAPHQFFPSSSLLILNSPKLAKYDYILKLNEYDFNVHKVKNSNNH